MPGDTSVIDLFTEPRPAPHVTSRTLPQRPASRFMPWNGTSLVLYDVLTSVEKDMGPGNFGTFSPDGSKLAWVSLEPGRPTLAWYIDLKSPTVSLPLGSARTADWFDNSRLIAFQPGGNNRELINVNTGMREPVPPAGSPDSFAQVLPDGGRLRRRLVDNLTFPGQPYPAPVYAFTLLAPDGRALLEFEAFEAKPAGEGELVVATRPLLTGTINIFIVKVATGQAQFVATSRFTPPSWPLGANAGYVVWTKGYCGASQGKTRLFDRRTRAVTELDQSLWVTMTPGGQIGAGEFGPSDLIDARTLQYTAVLPPRAGQQGPAIDVAWSPLYTYAARGQAFGHGGYCGG